MTDRDKRITDAQYLARKAVFDACVDASNMESDWENVREEMYLDIAHPDVHYLAFQYGHEGKGNQWATLGTDAVRLIDSLADDECWYSPHYVIDLDTGLELTWTTTTVITGTQSAYEELVREQLTDGGDQITFLGLQET